ncbi:aminotransferase class III-fold pyridoxal phosphate-dependent enzyme [Pseudomonas japonica]|uniref:aminotransferase class III-fold pyridoxal phosphate-dependent enzyme n=1 Tax=Pseudomonas japonica TaxID=256466 RepID=UPI003807E037
MNFDQIASEVIPRLSKIIGLGDDEKILLEDSLLDTGADSLMVLKCVDFINDRYGVALTTAQVYEELDTVGSIISAIVAQLPVQAPQVEIAVAATAPADVAPALPVEQPASYAAAPSTSRDVLIHTLLKSQMDLMSKHLQLLHAAPQAASLSVAAAAPSPAKAQNQSPAPSPAPTPDAQAVQREDRFNVFNTRKNAQKIVDPEQQHYLASYTETYSEKHRSSKAKTDRYRPVLADNRASAGFRPGTKEILFPLLADRTDGAHLWDVDGNRFIDITMGFGVHLLGHGPAFVKSKMIEQIQTGMPIGPQSPLAGRVAELVSELTGHERVVFCNSGTEATMTAVRLARAHTGRSKIVVFSESYHGTFDGFLARASAAPGEGAGGISVGRGIQQSSVQDTLVLEYDEPLSLDTIRARASEIAAVIVEPVQSRRPALQPQAFLTELREITRDSGIVFLWDEVITGFRIAPGGAQEHFGIRADLATYGKIVGGGIPIGLVAGNAAILDGIDGGTWQYGDQSAPQVEPIFFAGTFSKHPLAMAAAVQTLEHIQQNAATLYSDLNRLTRDLVERSNALFKRLGVDIRVEHFGSLFRYVSKRNLDLFFSHLLFNGVFVWEGRNCFLSTAHTEEDIDAILAATQAALQPLIAHGFMPAAPALSQRNATVWERRFTQLWQVPEHSLSVNIGGGIFFPGDDDSAALAQAVTRAVRNGDAVFSRFDAKAQQWLVVPGEISPQVVELSGYGDAIDTVVLDELVASEQQIPFAADGSQQLRATVFVLRGQGLLLCLTANHAACDGAALATLSERIVSLYRGEAGESLSSDLPLLQTLESNYRHSPQFDLDREFWLPKIAYLQGVTYSPVERNWQQPSHRQVVQLPRQVVASIARSLKITPFAWLLSCFARGLRQSPWADAGVVAVPFGNRGKPLQQTLCQLTNLLPLLPLDQADAASDAKHVGGQLARLAEHAAYPVLSGNHDSLPVFASINWEPIDLTDSSNGGVRLIHGSQRFTEFPLEVNIHSGAEQISVVVDFIPPLAERLDAWLQDVVAQATTAPEPVSPSPAASVLLEPAQ